MHHPTSRPMVDRLALAAGTRFFAFLAVCLTLLQPLSALSAPGDDDSRVAVRAFLMPDQVEQAGYGRYVITSYSIHYTKLYDEKFFVKFAATIGCNQTQS